MIFLGIQPVVQTLGLSHGDHPEKVCPIRADLSEQVRFVLKEQRVIPLRFPVVKDCAIADLRLHQVLEHVASVTEFGHKARPAVRHLADLAKTGYICKADRNTEFR